MQKYDLTDCSVVVPIQIDFKERLEHLLFIDSYFESHFINYQLILVEMDSEPKIQLPPKHNREVHFLQSREEFSLGTASNISATFDVDTLIHLFKTSTFKSLGGYNETFVGWGADDDEIWARFTNLGAAPAMLENYNAFHLEHPRKEGSVTEYLKNLYIAKVIEKMPAEESIDYIKTWNRFA